MLRSSHRLTWALLGTDLEASVGSNDVRGEPLKKAGLYAGCMALFIVGAHLAAAAVVSPHVVSVSSLAKDWSVGLFVTFIGGLFAAGSSKPWVRVAVLTIAVVVAWIVVVSVLPLWRFTADAILHNISEYRFAYLVAAIPSLLVASLAEAIRMYAARLTRRHRRLNAARAPSSPPLP